MGVELGKVLAKKILAQLDKPENVKGHDGSVSLRCTVGKYTHTNHIHRTKQYRQQDLFTTTKNTGRNEGYRNPLIEEIRVDFEHNVH